MNKTESFSIEKYVFSKKRKTTKNTQKKETMEQTKEKEEMHDLFLKFKMKC